MGFPVWNTVKLRSMQGGKYDACVDEEGDKKADSAVTDVISTGFKTQNILYILQQIVCECLLVFICPMLLFPSPLSQ